jgi:hypothetical protein
MEHALGVHFRQNCGVFISAHWTGMQEQTILPKRVTVVCRALSHVITQQFGSSFFLKFFQFKFFSFIDTLKREQKSRDADMALCIRGEPHREKDKNLIKTDRAILTLVQRFNPPNNANQMADHNYQIGLHHYIIEFLTGISSNYKMDP